MIRKVMALIDKINKKTPQSKAEGSLSNSLDDQDLILILNMIKESAFKGSDVERIYNLVIKVQNQLKDVQSKS